jgi:hypothetical protein
LLTRLPIFVSLRLPLASQANHRSGVAGFGPGLLSLLKQQRGTMPGSCARSPGSTTRMPALMTAGARACRKRALPRRRTGRARHAVDQRSETATENIVSPGVRPTSLRRFPA